MKKLILISGFILLGLSVFSMDISAEDVLLVAESTNYSLNMFDPYDGAYLGVFNNSNPGFGRPLNAVEGPDGNIYVSDQNNATVYVFDSEGNYLSIFTDSSSGIENIRGMEWYDGHLFITSGANYVAEFDSTGTRLSDFITDPSSPFDIYFLDDGKSLVSNSTTGNVNLYNADGSFNQTIISANFPEQIHQLNSSDYVVAEYMGDFVTTFDLTGSTSQIPHDGARGAYELGNGNLLVSSKNGVFEVDPLDGTIIETELADVEGRYIELVDISIPSTPTPEPTVEETPTYTPTGTPTIVPNPELQCPVDSIFSHYVLNYSEYQTACTSDISPGYCCYDNYSVSGTISEIQFWGVNAANISGWVPCNEDPMTFRIEFYPDDGTGYPDIASPATCSYELSLSRIDTGDNFMIDFPIYRYEATLDVPCTLTDGWLSIMGIGSNLDCWFLWMDAVYGDLLDANHKYTYESSFSEQDLDLAFCLDGDQLPTETPTFLATCTPVPTSTPTTPPTNTPTVPTGIPTYTPPPTYTPTVPFTPSPTPTVPTGVPTYTPIPTNTPEATPTATPECTVLGCIIEMPSDDMGPGDDCYCDVHICNPTDETYEDVPVFVILDVYGEYFFAPSYTEFDHYTENIQPGIMTIHPLPLFTWPANVGSAGGIVFYAAMTNQSITDLFGELDTFTFGWHE